MRLLASEERLILMPRARQVNRRAGVGGRPGSVQTRRQRPVVYVIQWVYETTATARPASRVHDG